jgi:itaconate CoA-transferase
MNLPLSGVTVVSIEQAIAAPMASRHLADWGARVIKIERPDTGDFARDYDHVMQGLSSQFVWTNRSKESLAIDIKSAQGRAVLETLLGKADVFIQNLAPGAAKRLGVDAKSLTARLPGIVACDISGYGSGGPYSDKKAYDLLVQCESGFVSINGSLAEPAKCGLSIADIAAGMYVLNGVLMGLFQRARTGRGMAFEVSLFDAMTEWMGYPAYYTRGSGKALARSGLQHATIAPYGPFRAGDERTVFFGIQNEREWRSFCDAVLGESALCDDPRFCSNPKRLENRETLRAVIESHFADWTSDQVLERLERAAIANARMNGIEEFLQHPQLQARRRTREIGSAAGPLTVFLPAITVDGVEPVMGPVPTLGEHNAAILAEISEKHPAMATK